MLFRSLRLHEYRAYREINPYDKKRFPSVRNPHFHTNEQERVYQEVYLGSTNKHKVVIQHSIDIEHMKKDKLRSYFAEALAMCGEFGLIDIMTFNHPYIEYYILQFYSTVHFGNDNARTLRWMTKDTMLEATMNDFGAVLGGYRDGGPRSPCGWRCHSNDESGGKELLAPITMEGGIPGQTEDLIQPFEILHRIYRECLAPRIGNWDQVHSYTIDLMANSKTNKGKGRRLDVMDFIYQEMWLNVIDKRVPIDRKSVV